MEQILRRMLKKDPATATRSMPSKWRWRRQRDPPPTRGRPGPPTRGGLEYHANAEDDGRAGIPETVTAGLRGFEVR
jgi:hypothetical protein